MATLELFHGSLENLGRGSLRSTWKPQFPVAYPHSYWLAIRRGTRYVYTLGWLVCVSFKLVCGVENRPRLLSRSVKLTEG